ncbi:hypothetical protein BH09DEP1_BH09DEP1_2190 [soil metagenome]
MKKNIIFYLTLLIINPVAFAMDAPMSPKTVSIWEEIDENTSFDSLAEEAERVCVAPAAAPQKKDKNSTTSGVCKECGKHVTNKYTHARVHTKEKHFVCDQCGKSYKHGSGLKEHQSTGACNKDSTMNTTGKRSAATSIDSLVDKEASHKEKKYAVDSKIPFPKRGQPWPCIEQCPACLSENMFIKHILTVHEKMQPFTCDSCIGKTTFVLKEELNRHLQNHHPDAPPCTVSKSEVEALYLLAKKYLAPAKAIEDAQSPGDKSGSL